MGNKRTLVVVPTTLLLNTMMLKFSKYSFLVVSPGHGLNKKLSTLEAFQGKAVMIVLCPSRLVEFLGYDSKTGKAKDEEICVQKTRSDALESFIGGFGVWDEAHAYPGSPFVSNSMLMVLIRFFFPNMRKIALTATCLAPGAWEDYLAQFKMNVSNYMMS
jgi:hypothetical protein